MTRNRKFVPWDIGGPLRDSSKSMGYALKTAVREYGLEITLDNRLMWQLWTVKGSKFNGKGGDYKAWFRAAYSIELAASERGIHPNDLCRELFNSKDPTEAVAQVVLNYDVDESVYSPVGERAVELFGSDPVTMSKNRVNEGSLEAVEMLYRDDTLMGIVSSAPTAESVIGYINKSIKTPLVEEGKIPEDAVLFVPELIYFGKTFKEDQLEDSVIKASEILGEDPRVVVYIADTNDDIIETAKANQKLREGGRPEIQLAMVKNGMGLPKMWERAWKEAGLKPGKNYHEFENPLEAARFIKGL